MYPHNKKKKITTNLNNRTRLGQKVMLWGAPLPRPFIFSNSKYPLIKLARLQPRTQVNSNLDLSNFHSQTGVVDFTFISTCQGRTAHP